MAKSMNTCTWNHPTCRGYNKRNGECVALSGVNFKRADCPFFNPKAQRHSADPPVSTEQARVSARRESPCTGCENEPHCTKHTRCPDYRMWVGDALRAARVLLMGVTQ